MPQLLTLARMARRVGVPAKWLRDQAESGSVPSLRAGTRFLFNADAVESTLARQAAQEPADKLRDGEVPNA